LSTVIPQIGSLAVDFDSFIRVFLSWLLLCFLILVIERWLKIFFFSFFS
jgi:hypothetical protein